MRRFRRSPADEPEDRSSPRLLWIDHEGGVDVFGCVADAERYVEHWALDDSDVIVDEEGTRFEARAEKRVVRLRAIGEADWNRVRGRLVEAGCDAATGQDEPGGVFDSLERAYGRTR